MELSLLKELLPTHDTCYDYLVQVEEHYNVNFDFFLRIRKTPKGYVSYILFCVGSGLIFDRMPDHLGTVSAYVFKADDGSIYPAMWANITHMAANFEACLKEDPPALLP